MAFTWIYLIYIIIKKECTGSVLVGNHSLLLHIYLSVKYPHAKLIICRYTCCCKQECLFIHSSIRVPTGIVIVSLSLCIKLKRDPGHPGKCSRMFMFKIHKA